MGDGALVTENAQPSRVIVRGMADFTIRAVQAIARLHKGDLLCSLVFAAVNNAGLSPLMQNAERARQVFAAPESLTDAELRPVSINAIAQSFGVPYETVRGTVTGLIKIDLCRRVEGGVIVPSEVLQRPAIVESDHQVSLVLDQTLASFAGIGFDFDQIAMMGGAGEGAAPPPCAGQVSWIASDFMLRGIEIAAPVFGDFTTSFTFLGVMTANARAITYDAAQAWTYAHAHTPPPDSARIPVSIRSLSEQIGVPFETTRRHVNRLVEAGRLRRLDEGVIIPTEVMQEDAFRANGQAVALRFARMIADLKRAGYRFPTEPERLAAANG